MSRRKNDVLFGFALGTAALLVTVFAARWYGLGRAATLFVFWCSGVVLFLLFFLYLFIGHARTKRVKRRPSYGMDDPVFPKVGSFTAEQGVWVRTFILFLNLGISALLAYTMRQIYSFGLFLTFLIALGGFVVLSGVFDAVERAAMKLVRGRKDR